MSISISGCQQTARILSEINLYSKKYYETRVRDEARKAWTAAQATPNPPSQISVINKCLAKFWENESEEIKTEIRDEYKRLKEQKNQPVVSDLVPRTAESYAAYVILLFIQCLIAIQSDDLSI